MRECSESDDGPGSVTGREMSLRLSIGAGRARLVQLVMVESALMALMASAVGAWFAWWSAPFIVGMINPPDHPARLALPADARVLGFGIALTALVTLLFGLIPALHASAVSPVSAMKGGAEPRFKGRLMHALIAVQVAFCFVVMFAGGFVRVDVQESVASSAGIFGRPVAGDRRGFTHSGAGRVLEANDRSSARNKRRRIRGHQWVGAADAIGWVEQFRFSERRASGAGTHLHAGGVAGMVRHHKDADGRRARFSRERDKAGRRHRE